MRFDVLTIFPGMFSPFLEQGILARAVKKGLVKVGLVNIRDFGEGPHRATDDRPYGGGDGMVMTPEPVYRALDSVKRLKNSLVILLSPQGERLNQAIAWELSRRDQLILACGRYEGIDERIRLLCVDRELSIGDYILSGGELAALVVMESVARLVPGVLGGERSNRENSFEEGILEYPQYTRPRVFHGKEVPSVLLSGDHEKIRLWRRKESLRRTLERRPDLLRYAALTDEDENLLSDIRTDRRNL